MKICSAINEVLHEKRRCRNGVTYVHEAWPVGFDQSIWAWTRISGIIPFPQQASTNFTVLIRYTKWVYKTLWAWIKPLHRNMWKHRTQLLHYTDVFVQLPFCCTWHKLCAYRLRVNSKICCISRNGTLWQKRETVKLCLCDVHNKPTNILQSNTSVVEKEHTLKKNTGLPLYFTTAAKFLKNEQTHVTYNTVWNIIRFYTY